MLSIILPAYNEEKMIPIAYRNISTIMDNSKIDFQLLFIDDGSTDSTWNEICTIQEIDHRIIGIQFSRNFGKEAAIFAGLEKAEGDCCVVMDCDLQHPPQKIPEMYSLWKDGYEVVEGVKESRGTESSLHHFAAENFYRIISKATGIDMLSSSDFKLLDKKVVTTLNALPEKCMFFRALSYWVGYRRTEVQYDVQKRIEGSSKWNTVSLIKYAIRNIGAFSSFPLQIVSILGFITLLIAIVFSTISLVQKLTGHALEGFTTVIILLLFIGSFIMLSLGIIGYYLSRIYDEIKGRPRYVIKEYRK